MDLTYPRVNTRDTNQLGVIFSLENLLFREDSILDASFWQRECLHTHWISRDDHYVGYLAVELNAKPGATVDDDSIAEPGTIYSIVVGILPALQGQGIGTRVKTWMTTEAPFLSGMQRILSTVRPTNARSIAFNERAGFVRQPNLLPGFYTDNGEDAIVFEYNLRNRT